MIGPLAAAHFLGVRQTAGVAIAALALIALLPAAGAGLALQAARVLVIALGGLGCVVVAGVHDRQRADLGRITRIAERAMIPSLPAELGGVRLAAHTARRPPARASAATCTRPSPPPPASA
ncbi:hypothetical protein MF672_039340 [Actinomadura sp. ATCC 31491]|uniref:Uncharacterized protein n=1 Tax=Actinomadura luzonensis TaxID=2805427 RepID=A0ABT0G6I0_9ACTN|nr:hypothetical protein [Actinomadura luzonensis]MCK2219810.1 hypothetical protein [Actinomadura luzonensis]